MVIVLGGYRTWERSSTVPENAQPFLNSLAQLLVRNSIKKGKCRPREAFEQGPVRLRAGEHPNAEQQTRQILAMRPRGTCPSACAALIDRRKNASISASRSR